MRKSEVFKKVRSGSGDGIGKVGTINVSPKGASRGTVPDNLPLATDTIAKVQYGGSAVRMRAAIVRKSRQPQGALRFQGDEE